MQFLSTDIAGVVLTQTEIDRDERGSFRRAWCLRESREAGIQFNIVQGSISETKRRGTLRGMHFQLPPSREGKLVQCTTGQIFDVALDLRPDSPTFLRHYATTLSADNGRALFIPPGCAHGFMTLTDNCSVLYLMTDFYEPALARGVRWNDPAFKIVWPATPAEILKRDAEYDDFETTLVQGFEGY